MAVVGGNKGRGRGGERCRSEGRVSEVSDDATVSAVAGDLFTVSPRERLPERLSARAACLTILRREVEVADLPGGLGTDPLSFWAEGSRSDTEQAGTDWSGGNSSTLRISYLLSNLISNGGTDVGVDPFCFLPHAVDHRSWLGVELLALRFSLGLKVKVTSAVLVAHFGLAPSSDHGS